MAQVLLNEPDTITAVMTRGQGGGRSLNQAQEQQNQQIQRRCTVQEFSFAAHVDGNQNREFVEEVAPAVVVRFLSFEPPLLLQRIKANTYL